MMCAPHCQVKCFGCEALSLSNGLAMMTAVPQMEIESDESVDAINQADFND